MDAIRKLHAQYNIHPENRKFHLAYQYDKKVKDWKFLGWRCVQCNKVFKRPDTVPQHTNNCRYAGISNKVMVHKNKSIEELKVKTQYGTDWKPLDFNQN
jgi:hypothetical protein